MLEPRPVDWVGGTLGYWQYDRKRETAAGAAALVPRQWSPPPDVAENNNMTISKDIQQNDYYYCKHVVGW